MIRANEVRMGDDFPDEDHQLARTRREIAEANIAEIKEAELKGRYIEKTAVVLIAIFVAVIAVNHFRLVNAHIEAARPCADQRR